MTLWSAVPVRWWQNLLKFGYEKVPPCWRRYFWAWCLTKSSWGLLVILFIKFFVKVEDFIVWKNLFFKLWPWGNWRFLLKDIVLRGIFVKLINFQRVSIGKVFMKNVGIDIVNIACTLIGLCDNFGESIEFLLGFALFWGIILINSASGKKCKRLLIKLFFECS